jgi:hypothetical protein
MMPKIRKEVGTLDEDESGQVKWYEKGVEDLFGPEALVV